MDGFTPQYVATYCSDNGQRYRSAFTEHPAGWCKAFRFVSRWADRRLDYRAELACDTPPLYALECRRDDDPPGAWYPSSHGTGHTWARACAAWDAAQWYVAHPLHRSRLIYRVVPA